MPDRRPRAPVRPRLSRRSMESPVGGRRRGVRAGGAVAEAVKGAPHLIPRKPRLGDVDDLIPPYKGDEVRHHLIR